jgi:hypothetical protein
MLLKEAEAPPSKTSKRKKAKKRKAPVTSET